MSKLRILLQYLPYIFHSIYFNFHYLPFTQALRLPILLYKPKLLKCKGEIQIDSDKISTGMIQLGKPVVSIYPNTGISIEMEGSIIFKGNCIIGNNSFISVGPTGTIIFGKMFYATSSLKLVCYKEILFGTQVLIGWENVFCDTDFHSIKLCGTSEKQRSYAPIIIGSYNWFAMKCNTMKGVKTPNNTIIGANSLLTRDYTNISEYCLIAGHPAKLIKSGVYRDISDDSIDYNN